MTKDLAQISTLPNKRVVNTEQFLLEIQKTLTQNIQQ